LTDTSDWLRHNASGWLDSSPPRKFVFRIPEFESCRKINKALVLRALTSVIMESRFIPNRPPPPQTQKCPSCNRELDIESFRASRSRKLLKRCRPCSGDKGVLESPQKAVSPPSKRNRHYTSPTKASPPPAPAFLLRGQYSQDDDETAVAREEQNNIRRRHRLADRHREERSPTPSLNTLMSRARAPLESPISTESC